MQLKKWRAEDGIIKPKAESAAIAGLIFNSLESEKLLMLKGKY